jgi:hypothetical protein
MLKQKSKISDMSHESQYEWVKEFNKNYAKIPEIVCRAEDKHLKMNVAKNTSSIDYIRRMVDKKIT